MIRGVWSFFGRLCRIGLSYWSFLWSFVRRHFCRLLARLRPAVSDDDAAERNDGNRGPSPGCQEEVERGPERQSTARQPDCETQSSKEGEDVELDATDELYCPYDSTWENKGPGPRTDRKPRRAAGFRSSKFARFEQAARDMQNYRHGYPSQIRRQVFNQDSQADKPNLEFHLGMRPCLPDGIYIQDFHNNWHREYDTLEYVHTYIQWLFPLPEPGMNVQAPTLTKAEIQEFLSNSTAKENLLKSYELMLDFYGITLCDKETGAVSRASNWRNRFNNLNSNTHNNLRITRILKCLGTLGFPHYQFPLVQFFLNETLVKGELPRVKDSVLNYFVFAVLDKRDRRHLLKFAYLNYVPKDEFVWCPKKIQRMWSREEIQCRE
ncbi:hypothetical protein Q5P01_002036 [Channa striata]|uniref:Opioid growth factor receptor (OGFr) conserved domain-containing protein n=1 Tax=Channa striata TaxID=64152 RepID=A0AA88T5T2_CHASR|nr:hypothetical protein Q5P01_002036 [Channa striata]